MITEITMRIDEDEAALLHCFTRDMFHTGAFALSRFPRYQCMGSKKLRSESERKTIAPMFGIANRSKSSALASDLGGNEQRARTPVFDQSQFPQHTALRQMPECADPIYTDQVAREIHPS